MGAVQMNGTNTAYASTITIVSGTLKGGVTNCLGGASAKAFVQSGTTLDVNDQNLGAVQVLVQGAGVNTNGAIINTGGAGQINALQKVKLTGDATFGGTGRWDIRGTGTLLDLAGYTLTKTNTNYIGLVGPNVTDGNILVNQGTLDIEGGASVSNISGSTSITVGPAGLLQFYSLTGPVTRPITVNGGTMGTPINGCNTNIVGSSVALAGATNILTTYQATGLILTGMVSGANTMLKTGDGLLKLAGNESFNGQAIVSAGMLELAGTDPLNGTLGSSQGLLINGSGTVQFDNSTALAGTNSKPVTVASGGMITTLNGGSSRISGAISISGGTIGGGTPDAVNGNWLLDTNLSIAVSSFITAPRTKLGNNGSVTFDVTNGATLTTSGAFEDAPGTNSTLVKTGLGTMLVSGSSTYNGATVISQGTMKLTPALPVSGPAVWYDASDISTAVRDTNGIAGQWVDKSGNNRTAVQTTQASKPAFVTNSLVNKTVMRFSGAQQMNANFYFLAGSPYSIFAVEGRTNNGNLFFLGTAGGGVLNQSLHFGYRASTNFTLAQYSNDITTTNNIPAYTNQIFRLWDAILDLASGHSLWEGGTNVISSTDKNPFNTGVGPGVVGAGYAGNNFQGDLAEILIYPRALNTSERQAVENYLTTKWAISGTFAPGATNYLPVNSALRVAAGATLDLGGVSQGVGSLSDIAGAGGLVTNNSAATVTLTTGNDNSDATFSGVIADGPGQVSFTKGGTGTQTLNGACTYSGITAINNGALIVNGPLATSQINQFNGSTLGGTGVITGWVQSDGPVVPGGTGTLTIKGDYGQIGMAANCGLYINIAGSNANSRLAVGGTATLASALVVTNTGYTPVVGDSYTVLTSSNAMTTFFASTRLPELTPATLGWKVDYQPNAVVLSVTSAPTATGYDAWAAGISGPLTNYNDSALGDGYPNLLKYATGSSPTNSDGRAQMNSTQTNGLFALKFSHNTNTTDLILYVEGAYTTTNDAPWVGIATNDHGSWGSATNVSEDTSTDPATDIVWDTDATATNRFLRLRVTRP